MGSPGTSPAQPRSAGPWEGLCGPGFSFGTSANTRCPPPFPGVPPLPGGDWPSRTLAKVFPYFILPGRAGSTLLLALLALGHLPSAPRQGLGLIEAPQSPRLAPPSEAGRPEGSCSFLSFF